MKSIFLSGSLCLVLLAPAASAQTQQPPPQQPPAQQTPPAAPGTPTIPKPTVQLPAATPKQTPTPPQERDTGGDAISVELLYWMTPGSSQPKMYGGAGNTTGLYGDLDFNGDKKYAASAIATIPTSRENSIEISYWRKQGSGTSILGQTESFFGDNFSVGDTVYTSYTVESAKLSWNYLTWPYPSNGAKLRIKTLWEVQYVGIGVNFNAPADVDAIFTNGTKDIILPTFGLGAEYHPSKHLRLEMKASGFGLLHHADIWDTQASVVARYGRIEVFLGEKAYHFKTSPQADHYFSQTIIGPYAGVRYMFK